MRKAKAAERVRCLVEAARVDDCDTLSALLAAKADANAHSIAPAHYLSTAAFAAADCGSLRALQLLIKAKADLNKPAERSYTPLHAAAQSGNCDMLVKLLAGKANVRAVAKVDGITPAHMAACNGHDQALRVLANAKADLNARSKGEGLAPVHNAATFGRVEVLRVLVEVRFVCLFCTSACMCPCRTHGMPSPPPPPPPASVCARCVCVVVTCRTDVPLGGRARTRVVCTRRQPSSEDPARHVSGQSALGPRPSAASSSFVLLRFAPRPHARTHAHRPRLT